MIDLTPLEVRKKKGDFRRIMRGYDPALVDDFLDLVADRLEALVRENMALAERTGRQDQQVAEYRDRERALTEALVTAQQMREDIRKQTVREAELAKRSAEQEVAQLRATVLQETKELRDAVEKDTRDLWAAAEKETRELRAAVDKEAKQLRASAQRDAAQIRTQLMLEREREEEAFRRLRGRQEQFLTSYRAFLERELSELGNLARVLGVATPGEEPEARARPGPNVFTPATIGPGAAAAAFIARSELTTSSRNSPPPPDPAAGEPPPEPVSELDEFFAPGDDPELLDLAFAEPVPATADDLGVVDPFADEPFEPEPLLPEDLVPSQPVKPTLRKQPNPSAGGEAANAVGWADTAAWDAKNPIGAGPANPSATGNHDVEGEDTSLLLRNAEAAGYRMPDLDQVSDELLLDDELPAPNPPKDEGWLPSLLEDDEK